MLPLEKVVASPRSPPTPPEPLMLGSEDAAQQGEPEAEADAKLEARVTAATEAEAIAEVREGVAKVDADAAEVSTGAAEVPADAAEVDVDAEVNTGVGEVDADEAEVSANRAEVQTDAAKDEIDAEVQADAAEFEVDAEIQADSVEVQADAAERTPVDLEFSRLRFREFAYQEAAGPHQTLARLHELCRQWLRPESCSKEEILEMLVLEQFLGILPDRVRPWVVAQYPENCKKAASLVEGLSDVLDEPGMLLCSPGGSSSELGEGACERRSDPLLLPGGLELPSLLPAWPALESMLLEQGSVGGEKSGEADSAKTELEKPKSFSEEPLPLVEWGHLDPAEENLQSYRKLLLWGYQLSQPDTVPRLETGEAGLEDLDLPEDSGPGDGAHQESEGDTCEDVSGREVLTDGLAEDAPVSPSGDVAQEEAQPEKVPDDQGEEDSKRGAIPPLEEQDKDAVGLASLQPGAGTKRPHPEDEEEEEGGREEGPECVSSSAGKELAPEDFGTPVEQDQAPGPSSAASPAMVEAGAGRGQPYPCSECGEAFAWIAHLAEHHSSHSSKKHRACPDC
ncbi:Zinc finger and SCAN domain-containing protein 18 [Fukomys damarensis]|uniref:Zinc finger and SCAN domain-containing protein 18 n=1 Tax=Fukomys damarensis TaxID=885580 RepID=A0A091E166_FUKDA|nr:Zinc finger and SCAN domain-containing protein 18 [Fukomys damarensis]